MSNIISFLMPVLFFSYFTIVGYSILILLNTNRNILKNLLLSPSIGLSVTLLFVFTLNRIGLPVASFGKPLTITLLIFSSIILLEKKKVYLPKRYFKLTLLLLLALLLVGWPLFLYGFHWLSYVNEDMTNYALGAMRFLHNGFYARPNSHLLNGSDYPQYYWLWHIASYIRPGSELMLAWVSSITNILPLKIFMPTILAFHLVMISSSMGLVYLSKKYYKVALYTGLFLAVSGLVAMGTLYQLIAQVDGLAIMLALSTFIFQKFSFNTKLLSFKQGMLIGLLTAALTMFYPELLPILAFSYIIYFMILHIHGWRINKNYALIVLVSILIFLLLVNTYIINIYIFSKAQFHHALDFSQTHNAVFPYYLKLTGLTYLWSLLPVGLSGHVFFIPFLVISLIFTSLLILGIIYQSVAKLIPIAFIALTMLILAIKLVLINDGFGLYKLAMYAQPFILGTVALLLFSITKRKKLFLSILGILVLLPLISQGFYTKRSTGTPGMYVEVPYGTIANLPKSFSNILQTLPKDGSLLIMNDNVVIAKIQSMFTRGWPVEFASQPFFLRNLLAFENVKDKKVAKLINQGVNNLIKLNYSFKNRDKSKKDPFLSERKTIKKNQYLLINKPLLSVINRSKFKENEKGSFYTIKLSDARDYLTFVNSQLGQHFYFSTIYKNISMFQIRDDFAYPHNTLAGIGHILLFRLISPSKNSRFILNITNSNFSGTDTKLPVIHVIAKNNSTIPIIGNGSARVVSNPIKPRKINGSYYAMLEISDDYKGIITYARNISLISESEYRKISPPTHLDSFPADLRNRNLIYSGYYEDGWVADQSDIELRSPSKTAKLRIQGMIPSDQQKISSLTQLSVILNKQLIKKLYLPSGKFNVILHPKSLKTKNELKLIFNKEIKPSKHDRRMVSAKIAYIGF